MVKGLNSTRKEEFPDLKGARGAGNDPRAPVTPRRVVAAMKELYDRKAMQAEKARRKKAKEAERQRVAEAKAEADRRDYRCAARRGFRTARTPLPWRGWGRAELTGCAAAAGT